jgi:hypothetical protein
MAKRKIYFDGQQDGERVLCEVRPHPLALYLGYFKVLAAVVLIWVGFSLGAQAIPALAAVVTMIRWVLVLVVGAGGFLIVAKGEKDNVAFFTDRRVIRFAAVTPFATNSRSLAWDEVVKVKTYPTNVLWRLLNVGRVVVHAKSTVLNVNASVRENVVTDDDVAIDYVHYYHDLGYYVDKILFAYKRKPEDLEQMRPFVFKPRWKRY